MWFLYVIQWIHVLCGTFWLGGALYGNFIVIPAVATLPLETQRKVAKSLGVRGDKVMTIAALLVIVFGLVRGIVFGPVRSLSFLLGTAYGMTFLLAFLIATATLAWGTLVMSRTFRRLFDVPQEDILMPDGTLKPAFASLLQRAKLFGLLELVGFLVVFSCMILLGIGL